MLDGKRLTSAAARFSTDAEKAFERALSELISLAYDYAEMGDRFLWELDPELDDEANAILRGLSDECREKAVARLREVLYDEGLGDYFDEADEDASGDGNDGGWTMLGALDLEGSHMKEMTEIWIAIAFAEGMTQTYLKTSILKYLRNPFLSPLWKDLPRDLLKWGRGYQKDVLGGITVIGQDYIISGARHAEWMGERDGGATYYIRRRGSGYMCTECDSMCGYPIPIDTPFEYVHPRCMCWPEYHHEPMSDV